VLATNLPGIREIAGFIPSVHSLPLDRSDDEWAAQALRILETSQRPDSKRLIAETFLASPFTISRAVAEHAAVLEHAPRV
jgi:hypothetical protein